MTINNTSTILLVSLPAKLRTLRSFTFLPSYFLEFLLYLNLSEGFDDITHLDVVEVHQ